MSSTLSPRRKPMVVKPVRVPAEWQERIDAESSKRPDWSESDILREAIDRGLTAMESERKPKRKS